MALAYTMDSWWRNRAEFVQGRPVIIEFLTRKWRKEKDYRLIKELWAFEEAGSRYASPMSGMMIQEIGLALTATRTRSLKQTD